MSLIYNVQGCIYFCSCIYQSLLWILTCPTEFIKTNPPAFPSGSLPGLNLHAEYPLSFQPCRYPFSLDVHRPSSSLHSLLLLPGKLSLSSSLPGSSFTSYFRCEVAVPLGSPPGPQHVLPHLHLLIYIIILRPCAS